MQETTFKIYQVKKEKLKDVDYLNNKGVINSSDYNCVYSGTLPNVRRTTEILNKLFRDFNINHPKDYKGRSMSVYDVVELENSFYQCNTFGWSQIDFKKESNEVFSIDMLQEDESKMSVHEMKVIDVIEKALSTNLLVKDENVIGLLVELLETCHKNIGIMCLTHNKAEVAENMRQFYQIMIPVIGKLNSRSSDVRDFLETPLGSMKDMDIL